MTAIILAAGKGSRLLPYTASIPKCLLQFDGESILTRQLRQLRRHGIEDIVVVTGYLAELVKEPHIRYFVNRDFDESNMVHSLFCAEPVLAGDVLICYGDVIVSDRVMASLLQTQGHDVYVVADEDWGRYYERRFGNKYAEAESLVIDDIGRITDIGRDEPALRDVMARYVGLLKLTATGSDTFRELYQRILKLGDALWIRGRPLKRAFMTDLLQGIIDEGRVSVYAHRVQRGWIEFDSASDYENALKWLRDGSLAEALSA